MTNAIAKADLDVEVSMLQSNKYSKGTENTVKVARIDIQIKAELVASKVEFGLVDSLPNTW